MKSTFPCTNVGNANLSRTQASVGYSRRWAIFILGVALLSSCGDSKADQGEDGVKRDDSSGFADLSPSTAFAYFPISVDPADGKTKEVECEEHPNVYSVNEAALKNSRYYRFCGAGEALVLGIQSVSYGTPFHMARIRWRDASGTVRETTILTYFADDDGDYVADTSRRVVECYTEPYLGVTSTETVFNAQVGERLCVTDGFETYFPVHYFFESLQPLTLRLKLPDGTERVVAMHEIEGSGDVQKPTEPVCGLSTCGHLK